MRAFGAPVNSGSGSGCYHFATQCRVCGRQILTPTEFLDQIAGSPRAAQR
jgi:hypothetical protein